MTAHVLFVDDEESNLDVWQTAFASHFAVLTTTDPQRALQLMASHEVAVIIADQRMPGMTGTQLLEHARDEYPDAIRILITGYTDLSAAVDAINRGHVRRYLRKPCELSVVRAEVQDAMELYTARVHGRAMERRLLVTERVYALGLIAAGLGRELTRPAELIRESIVTARAEAHDIAGTLDPTQLQLRSLRTRLEELGDELARAMTGVDRVLDLARSVELRPPDASPERVDVGAVLQLALRIVRGELRRGADMELDIRDVPAAVGDSNRLGQVILTLLVNALDALSSLPAGRRLITVRLFAEGGFVRLEVMDNGATIAAEDLARVFDPFHTSLKHPRGGGGLGLAIAKTLVDEMGGKLYAEALPRGAVFRVLLPEQAS